MAITGIQNPTSPQKRLQSNGNVVYIRRFQYDRDYDWSAEMPALGSLDGTYGYFRGYSSTINGPYLTVELTYDSEGTVVNFSPSDGDTEYWAETRGEETPLEFADGYRTKWNYNLWYKDDDKQPRLDENDFPLGGLAGYNAATNLDGLRGDARWRWDKGDPGSEYYLAKGKSKPGTEFFLRPVRVVFRRGYHRQQSDAESDLKDVGYLVLPGETFGLGGAAQNWLVTSSNTQYDGKYWVTETEYMYSEDQWDSDLYSLGPLGP